MDRNVSNIGCRYVGCWRSYCNVFWVARAIQGVVSYFWLFGMPTRLLISSMWHLLALPTDISTFRWSGTYLKDFWSLSIRCWSNCAGGWSGGWHREYGLGLFHIEVKISVNVNELRWCNNFRSRSNNDILCRAERHLRQCLTITIYNFREHLLPEYLVRPLQILSEQHYGLSV